MLVGVSGGPDSTALLLLFAELKARDPGGFPELIAGHVHHGLRGEGADRDAEFAAGAARALGIECLVERVDARAEARRRSLSLEAAGRALRYDAFARWARERGIDAVALAHHADDQAE
ncbi:MAG: tRNA lysidine(34) synthetase TilS, partial [Planctomycetes bacterium]|nr:tRNA lysidine(34) synthetase TilS [Planctomycetota bacterium]